MWLILNTLGGFMNGVMVEAAVFEPCFSLRVSS